MKNHLKAHLYEKIKRSDLLAEDMEKQEMLEKIHKLIFRNSYDMISLLDKESKPIFVNHAHKRILGYDKKFLLERPALDLFHPDDKRSVEEEWYSVIEKKQDREQIVGRFKAKDGDYIWLETHLKTLTDKKGDIAFVLCISRDISDKIQAERELKKNKEKVQNLHEVAHKLDTCRTEDEVFDICMEAATKILNFDYISTFKKVKNGFESKAVSYEIKPKLKGNVYNKDNYTWKTYLNGKSFLVRDIDDDDGAEAGLKEYKSGLSIPIGDYGVFQALSRERYRYDEIDLELAELLVSHVNEAIKRIRYRRKLKRSEEKYRYIFENTGTAMVIIEEDMTIALINERGEKLTGYSKDEIEGKMSIKDLLVKDQIKKLSRYHHVRRHDEESVPNFYETKIVTKFGDKRNIFLTVGMMPDSDRSIVSALDITKSKKNLRALTKSEEGFRLVFHNSPVAMIRTDENLNILDINEQGCELFEKSEEELLDKNLEDFILNIESNGERIFKNVINGDASQFELSIDVDGDPVNVEFRADPITNVEDETKFILIQEI